MTHRINQNTLLAIALIIIFISILSVAFSQTSSTNFSQYPGFQKHFSTFPRYASLPTTREKKLLQKYRPRLFLGKGQEGPISFYKNYIANGTLYNGAGKVISDNPTPSLMNQYKEDPYVTFVHKASPGKPITPIVFARIDHADVPGAGVYTFLTYHFVFRSSGVPAGIPGWLRTIVSWAGDPHDWHQLDHYTMARVALDRGSNPVSVILQQHNYIRSYILGRDMPFPKDNRIKIDTALNSNELYPHLLGRQKRRAVPFMTAANLPYLVTGKHTPWLSTDDITDPEYEVEYELEFLRHTDAFYTFQGYLGEKRLLPGRSGPPGADYNGLPKFKHLAIELAAFNWREGDLEQMDYLIDFLEKPDRQQEVFIDLTTRFRIDVACQLRKNRIDCQNHTTPSN